MYTWFVRLLSKICQNQLLQLLAYMYNAAADTDMPVHRMAAKTYIKELQDEEYMYRRILLLTDFGLNTGGTRCGEPSLHNDILM